MIKNLYLGLREAFHTYSEHFIFYYVYQLTGVWDQFSLQELTWLLDPEYEFQNQTVWCSTCLGNESTLDLFKFPEFDEEQKEVHFTHESETTKLQESLKHYNDEFPERLLSLKQISVEHEQTLSNDDTKEIESLLLEIDHDK